MKRLYNILALLLFFTFISTSAFADNKHKKRSMDCQREQIVITDLSREQH